MMMKRLLPLTLKMTSPPRLPTPEDTIPQSTEQLSPAVSTLISTDTSSSVETQELSPAPSPSVPDSAIDSSETITTTTTESATDSSETVTTTTTKSVTELISLLEDSEAPKATEDSQEVEAEPAPVPSDDSGKDDLTLTESPEVSVDPLPSNTDLLSQDLITTTVSVTEQKTNVDDLISTQTNTSTTDSSETVMTTTTKSVTELISLLEDSETPKATEDSQEVEAEPAPVPSEDSEKDDLMFTESPQVEAEAAPAPSDDLRNDELRTLAESSEVLVDPVPSTTDNQYSHDLLSGPESQSEKTVVSLDELAVDVIPIDTGSDRLSTDRTLEDISQSPTEEQPADTQSPEASVDPLPSNTDLLSQDLITTTVSVTEQKTNVDGLISTQTNTSTTESSETVTTTTTKSVTELISLLEDSETPKATEDSSVDLLDPIPVDTTPSPAEPFTPLSSRETLQNSEASLNGSDSKPEALLTTEEEHGESEAKGAEEAEDVRTTVDESISNWRSWRTPAITSETETIEASEPEPQRPPPATLDSRSFESTSQELSALDPLDSKKNFVYVKEYVNSELAQHKSNNRGDEYVSSRSSTYSYSSPPSNLSNCTYCGELVGSDAKITIEDLNIYCHPSCFKCGVCSRPMGDLLYSMFLHDSMVHCESCYSNVL
ncbi:hypothetical protein SKAU_G00373560 [Synaphobranchus kaupii]|uniref:LIM zinc-binding domain-containing protein n=1 Tax=Synaphobranchus kaupii TaxID=118154 RepID=A0A9Q1EGL5_SYNKA|nr:hypothetical protein SKAU_G00373560 [Synaphobranchus kaupii]